MRSSLSSQPAKPFSRLASARAAIAWSVGFSAVGVTASVFIPEIGRFLAIGVVAVALCGAVAHASLLSLASFRRLQGGQVIAVALATLVMVAFVLIAFNALYPERAEQQALMSGVFEAIALAAMPVLLAAFLVTLLVERAGT